ncbi:MAG: hypothetical protein HZC10_05870 [Nitrospirae bacterium]|nr:hypothetical protein [Nitrospirota bacterium]
MGKRSAAKNKLDFAQPLFLQPVSFNQPPMTSMMLLLLPVAWLLLRKLALKRA